MLLNKTTFTRDFSCILLQVPCAHAYASSAVEGVVVTGNFRRDPDKSCSCFTVANIHINSECAKRRSVCVALLLLIRDVCLKLGAVVLTGDFNNGAECELSPRCSESQRRNSPLEAAFSSACALWPTLGSHRSGVLAMNPIVTRGLSVAGS